MDFCLCNTLPVPLQWSWHKVTYFIIFVDINNAMMSVLLTHRLLGINGCHVYFSNMFFKDWHRECFLWNVSTAWPPPPPAWFTNQLWWAESSYLAHDDVIKWKNFPRYWPFVRGIHRSPVDSPHKCQWHGALMFSVICAWTNDWANNWDAGDLGRHRVHIDVTVM